LPDQAAGVRQENELLAAKARRLQSMLVAARPREEGLIHTVHALEQARPLTAA
jgi:hypothetical protein